MSQITGKVQSKSRAGTGIKINNTWYNGKTDMLATVEYGSEATIEVDDKNNVIAVITAAPAADTGPAKAVAKSGGWDDPRRQEVIVFQSARNAAIDVVDKMIQAGAVALPSKQADKLDAYNALVSIKTVEYYNQAMLVYEGQAANAALGVDSE